MQLKFYWVALFWFVFLGMCKSTILHKTSRLVRFLKKVFKSCKTLANRVDCFYYTRKKNRLFLCEYFTVKASHVLEQIATVL